MPKKYLNNTSIESSHWCLLNAESEQLSRLATQTGLPQVDTVSSSDNKNADAIIIDQDNWPQITSKPNQFKSIGLVIDGSTEIEIIEHLLQASSLKPDVIFIDFPVFHDGRGYSLARLLRRASFWQGQLGAIGDILQDQIFFYWRCGFDIIQPRHDQNIHACHLALQSFTHVYQLAERQPFVAQ